MHSQGGSEYTLLCSLCVGVSVCSIAYPPPQCWCGQNRDLHLHRLRSEADRGRIHCGHLQLCAPHALQKELHGPDLCE